MKRIWADPDPQHWFLFVPEENDGKGRQVREQREHENEGKDENVFDLPGAVRFIILKNKNINV